jgi:aminoglycoside 3-N-acetyltransferase
MPEEQTIRKTDYPGTIESLKADLISLGVKPGMVLLVHSSLNSMGWICGGAVAVSQALMDVLTPDGTLVMPTHSSDLSDPARWSNPPVPVSWVESIRATMPAFHPAYTPTREMGRIPEVFRTIPGVLRSNHPTLSFAAWGKDAERITNHQHLGHSLGEYSPLARIYELHGFVLLLGVGFANNTSFHLGECRAIENKVYTEGSPIFENGSRVWKEYEEIEYDAGPFEQIGADFEQTGIVRTGKIMNATARLFPQRMAVDFAMDWLNKKRSCE